MLSILRFFEGMENATPEENDVSVVHEEVGNSTTELNPLSNEGDPEIGIRSLLL